MREQTDNSLQAKPQTTRLDITLNFPNGARLSPEDIALIAAVRKARSILGASRATGISYRKCWLVVDALNRMFDAIVFETFPGRRGGGAELTPFGERLVALYDSVNRRAQQGAKAALNELAGALNPDYQPKTNAAPSSSAWEVAVPGQSRQL